MTEFVNDFKIFFSLIFDKVIELFNWYMDTYLGEILIFIIIIGVFITIFEFFVELRKTK